MSRIARYKSFSPAEIIGSENQTSLSRHAEEAAFLWLLRDAAVRAPHYKLKDLAKLEERLEAHLDGLRVAGETGWEILSVALEEAKPGVIFAAGVVAFEDGNEGWIRQVVAAGTSKPQAARGLVSALGWLPYDRVARHIKGLLASELPAMQRAGLAASAIHRRNPGNALVAALSSTDPALKARALKAAGELGMADTHINTRANVKSKNPTVQFWAAWATALFGKHKDAVACLQAFAEAETPFSDRAAQMAARCLAIRDAKLWIRKLAKELHRTRAAVVAIGALGDPDLIAWLIEQMTDDHLARVAGESFSLITGADLAYLDLDRDRPEGFEPQLPPPVEADGTAEDPDKNLPWPDARLVFKWWAERRAGFQKDTRYLLSRPIDKDSLRLALKEGYQRQRTAAALELALLSPGRPLFETRAPAQRQIQMLA